MSRLTLVLLILSVNLAYVVTKIASDVRARRWAAVLVGIVCTLGVYGIIIGGVYLSVQSSTDL